MGKVWCEQTCEAWSYTGMEHSYLDIPLSHSLIAPNPIRECSMPRMQCGAEKQSGGAEGQECTEPRT